MLSGHFPSLTGQDPGSQGTSCSTITFSPQLSHSHLDKQVSQPTEDASVHIQSNFIQI